LYERFLRWVDSPRPIPQSGGPPLVGYPRLIIIQYFRSCPSPQYLNAVSSMRHAVVTWAHATQIFTPNDKYALLHPSKQMLRYG
jgi:hypothetical protein